MIRVTVKIEGVVAAAIARLGEGLADTATLHDAIRAEAEAQVRAHILKLKSRSPNTNYYGKAAAGVNSSADAKSATVSILQAGYALRREGGTVTPGRTNSSKTGKPTKALALPTKYVPIRNQERAIPRDFPLLAFIPNRKGGDTIGYLVEGVAKTAKRGKNKGKNYIAAKSKADGGKLLFVLRSRTRHKPDPSVLPLDTELIATATRAITDYINILNSAT